jgi:diguanylate cyclase (GGDEF)-like protein
MDEAMAAGDRARERRLAGMFESWPCPAAIARPDGTLLAVNRRARALAGEKPARTCRELLGCRLSEAQCPLRRVMIWRKTENVCEVPVRTRHRTGWVVERLSVWRDPASDEPVATLAWEPATALHYRRRVLRRRAREDALTGLLNRGGFDEVLRRRASRRAGDAPAAVLMIDVDGLKKVNDAMGHAAGDGVLAAVGRGLLSSLRRGDVAGRVGGDEFAVYCPGTPRRDARRLAERMRSAIESNGAKVSIGVACGKGARSDELRRVADRALYREKRGKGGLRP